MDTTRLKISQYRHSNQWKEGTASTTSPKTTTPRPSLTRPGDVSDSQNIDEEIGSANGKYPLPEFIFLHSHWLPPATHVAGSTLFRTTQKHPQIGKGLYPMPPASMRRVGTSLNLIKPDKPNCTRSTRSSHALPKWNQTGRKGLCHPVCGDPSLGRSGASKAQQKPSIWKAG